MPKISVVVPVYNVEEYLGECLDSIVGQTLEDIEIICVNDGSSDGCLEILNEYESKDDRIKVISQENKGLSGARNTALKHVSGEYIYYMDSDDILCINALEKAYETAKEKSLDLLIFKLINFDDETREKFPSKYYDMKFLSEAVGDNVFSHRDIPEDIFDVSVTMSSKLFKRQLVEDMEFIEGYIFEDNPYFIESLFRAERVFFLDEYLYLKRARGGSITASHNDKFFDFIPISNMLIDISKRYGVYDAYKGGLFSKILTNIYYRFTQVDDVYKEEFFSKIKEDFNAKKDEYDNDEVFQNLDDRLKEIFYSAIESQNPREFELSIRCIDLDRTILKRDEEIELKNSRIREIRTEKLQLINNSQKVSSKLTEFAYKNKKLIKENKNYKKEIEDLKNVNSQLMQSTSWKVTKPMRMVGGKVKK